MSAQDWLDDAWLDEVRRWVVDRLGSRQVAVTGSMEQTRARPWSTVFTVPTTAGLMWFKASAPGTAYEVPLLAALGRWCPDRVVAPLEWDVERGWMLLPDGGQTLRAASGGDTALSGWERILSQYAEMQRLLEDRVQSLLSLGTPDLRPVTLPSVRASLLEDEPALRFGQENGMTREQHAALLRRQKEYAGWCAELEEIGVPPSLQHDDLHDANVFVPGPGSTLFRVFDWGDACVGHPFASLLVSLRVVADLHSLPNRSPEVLRLRDAYLQAWSGSYEPAALGRASVLACRVAGVGRADSYRRALLTGDRADWQEWGVGIPGWLLEDGDATPLASEDPAP